MFKNLFSKRSDSPTEAAANEEIATPRAATTAPGTQIEYHPDLITRFDGHHAALRKLFDAITASANKGDFSDTAKSMQALRRVLVSHLLEENVKLYTYLSKCLAKDPVSASLVRGMKTEMGGIGTNILRFLDTYIQSGVTPFNKSAFLIELAAIGEALHDRLEREEGSLYTLYMQPNAFG